MQSNALKKITSLVFLSLILLPTTAFSNNTIEAESIKIINATCSKFILSYTPDFVGISLPDERFSEFLSSIQITKIPTNHVGICSNATASTETINLLELYSNKSINHQKDSKELISPANSNPDFRNIENSGSEAVPPNPNYAWSLVDSQIVVHKNMRTCTRIEVLVRFWEAINENGVLISDVTLETTRSPILGCTAEEFQGPD